MGDLCTNESHEPSHLGFIIVMIRNFEHTWALLSKLIVMGYRLKNLLQRLVVLGTQRPISLKELSLLDGARGESSPSTATDEELWHETMPLRVARQRLEKRYLEIQLAAHGWSVKKTAAALDILPNNLSRRLGELEIKINSPLFHSPE